MVIPFRGTSREFTFGLSLRYDERKQIDQLIELNDRLKTITAQNKIERATFQPGHLRKVFRFLVRRRWLDLRKMNITSLGIFPYFFDHVEVLLVGGNKIKDLAALRSFKQLRYLEAQDNLLSTLDFIDNMSALRGFRCE